MSAHGMKPPGPLKPVYDQKVTRSASAATERFFRKISVALGSCVIYIALVTLTPTVVQSVEVIQAGALKDLVGTTWMYGGLWASNRPDPADPATVRLRFPTEGKVEVVGPCGSEAGELEARNPSAPPGTPVVLLGKFISGPVAAECPGSPRQGIVGDLIRSGLEVPNRGMQALFRAKGHTFFEDTETGLTPLAGTSWDVESVDEQAIAPLHWNVEFLKTGVVGGSDGCNGFGGFYVTKGDRLRTSDVSSTAIGCSYDSPLPRPFRNTATSRFNLTAEQLTISEEGGHKFVLRAKSFGLPLTGTKWKSTLRGQRVSLTFLPDSRAQISTSCFSTETSFTQKRLQRFGMQYLFMFDLSPIAKLPEKGNCRVGFELVRLLQNVSIRSQDSLVLRLGGGDASLVDSFQPRVTFELDTPIDPSKALAGTRWRLNTLSPASANEIGFRANGTFVFDTQCGSWIYRVVNGTKLNIQQKNPCSPRTSTYPFGNPVVRFALSADRKTLELFNIADRSIAQYDKLSSR